MNDAQRRVANAVAYVSRQWGHGWGRLGESMQEALVRAEILAEIARLGIAADPVAYRSLVDELATFAMQWTPHQE